MIDEVTLRAACDGTHEEFRRAEEDGDGPCCPSCGAGVVWKGEKIGVCNACAHEALPILLSTIDRLRAELSRLAPFAAEADRQEAARRELTALAVRRIFG